jgi:hypothetical protein
LPERLIPDPLPNVVRLNRALEAAWRSGLLPRPRLDQDALVRAALRGRSLDALGREAAWSEPLHILTHAIESEADLNPLGQAMAHGQIVMALRTRIRAVALWRRKPEVLERRTPPPIIILGQMRSGTTRLQRLLACDNRLAHTRLFESLLPVPRRGRKLQAGAILAILQRLNPELSRIHPTSISAPDEEFGLFSPSVGSAQFEAQWRVPSFSRWWEQQPTENLYEEFKCLLQTLAWSRGEKDGRRSVIKAPQFMQDLSTVLSTFPGATLLWLRRDPAEAVASAASLVWNQMRIQSNSVDRAWVGREWLRKTRLRQERTETALAGADAPTPHIVEYQAMNRDWRSEISKVYDHIGLELTPAAERRMDMYIQAAQSHRGHRYSLAQFGLSPAQVQLAKARSSRWAARRA